MGNNIKIIGKFYLRNGIIIEEEVEFDNSKEDVAKLIQDIKHKVKEGFREDYNFQFTFGYTVFRGEDISAVTFTSIED